jgi:hypothetical protein
VKERIKGILRKMAAEFEYLVILVGAGVVAALSLLDVISEVKPLIASVLAVLSILAFAILRQNARRRIEVQEVALLRSSIEELRLDVASMLQELRSARTVLEISAAERNVAFDEALSNPTLWHFRGSMGSYLRSRTLRRLADSARGRAGNRSQVTIQILDPADIDVCQEFARYRRRLDEQRGNSSANSWTVNRVRLECLAAIIATAWYAQHENLDIKIGVLNRMSTLRFDVSQEIALITNEDRDFPALGVRSESKLYHAIVRDIDASMTKARPINLAQLPELPLAWQQCDSDTLFQFVLSVGIGEGVFIGDTSGLLLQMAFDRNNDYVPPFG